MSTAQACPVLHDDFQRGLRPLREKLLADQAHVPLETARRVEGEVHAWGSRVNQYYTQKAGEIREMMVTMMDAAQAVGKRDQEYRNQFHEVSSKLQTIGNLEDLTEIRELVSRTASELRSRAERMVEDGNQSLEGLRQQLQAYEKRADENKRLAETDKLTGLANRAGVERGIDERIQASLRFSLLICDLNGFKALNDLHGHLVGDELLKSFADELRAQFRPRDIIGRWGGDEFVVILDEADPAGVIARVERIRNWAFGEYTIRVAGTPVKTQLTAAVGVASWRPGMTASDVFRQADQAMYADKQQNGKEISRR